MKDSGGGAASTISENNTIEDQHKRSKSQSKRLTASHGHPLLYSDRTEREASCKRIVSSEERL